MMHCSCSCVRRVSVLVTVWQDEAPYQAGVYACDRETATRHVPNARYSA